MPNLTQLWCDVLARATVEERDAYMRHPFPATLDASLTDLVRAFEGASDAERKTFLQSLGHENSHLLIAYCERMATLGVRESSPRRLADGLVAIAIEGFRFDARDAIVRLALIYHSAEKLRVNPRELFDAAASMAGDEVAETLRRFTRERPPAKRTLGSMGYRESGDRAQPLLYERAP
jgi:hypothetical protein